MDVSYEVYQIERFIDQHWGTAIGESVHNRLANIREEDKEAVMTLYNELEEQGYVG